METSTQTPSSSGAIAEAATAAVGADPVTAELLAKRAAGEKLTPSEYGKLGAFAFKVKRLFGPKNVKGTEPDKSRPGESSGLASLAEDEATDNGLVSAPIDADLVRNTTDAVLGCLEDIAKRKLNRAGKDAGADSKALARLDAVARVPATNRKLMLDTSPQVAEALGINPKHYPVAMFFGAFGLWATSIWLAVDELKELKQKKTDATATKDEKPNVSIFTGPTLPDPPKPKNAPPEIV